MPEQPWLRLACRGIVGGLGRGGSLEAGKPLPEFTGSRQSPVGGPAPKGPKVISPAVAG